MEQFSRTELLIGKENLEKLKNSKVAIFGIGGVIASKNLKRSKKKYRTTVISIVVSIFIFISLSSILVNEQNSKICKVTKRKRIN